MRYLVAIKTHVLALLALLFIGGCGGGGDCAGQDCLFLQYPEIQVVRQPQGTTVAEGQAASFDIVVSSVSDNPVSVQWQRWDPSARAWHDLAGETNFSLTLARVAFGDDTARFRAKVRAQDGQSLTSDEAVLRVVAADGTVFHDETFIGTDWTTTSFVGDTGGSVASAQSLVDGNPGEYRSVTLSINAASVGTAASVFSFHWFGPAVYEPQRSGAIRSIDYARDERLLAGRGSGQASALVLRQDGKVFFAVYGFVPESTWVHRTSVGLSAADFTSLAPDLSQGAERPDFSAAGTSIEFGFLRANSTVAGGAAYTTRGGIDNWRVTVHR